MRDKKFRYQLELRALMSPYLGNVAMLMMWMHRCRLLYLYGLLLDHGRRNSEIRLIHSLIVRSYVLSLGRLVHGGVAAL